MNSIRGSIQNSPRSLALEDLHTSNKFDAKKINHTPTLELANIDNENVENCNMGSFKTDKRSTKSRKSRIDGERNLA